MTPEELAKMFSDLKESKMMIHIHDPRTLEDPTSPAATIQMLQLAAGILYDVPLIVLCEGEDIPASLAKVAARVIPYDIKDFPASQPLIRQALVDLGILKLPE